MPYSPPKMNAWKVPLAEDEANPKRSKGSPGEASTAASSASPMAVDRSLEEEFNDAWADEVSGAATATKYPLQQGVKLALQMGVNSQKRIREMEGTLQYALILPAATVWISAFRSQMKKYTEGTRNRKGHGLGSGAAWAMKEIMVLTATHTASLDTDQGAHANLKVVREHLMQISENAETIQNYVTKCVIKDTGKVTWVASKDKERKEKKLADAKHLVVWMVKPESRNFGTALQQVLIQYYNAENLTGVAPPGPLERKGVQLLKKLLNPKKR